MRVDVEIRNVGPRFDLSTSGTFDTPAGATAPGPLMPGESFEITFLAPHGSRLSFATTFVQSNDLFFAPPPEGIPLWISNMEPATGDITGMIALWDAGTEIDQEPGLGADQAPRQSAPDDGAPDPNPAVRLAEDTFGNLPATGEVLRATLEYEEGFFTLRIENVSTTQTLRTSGGTSLAVPLSPGVFAVHMSGEPLFSTGSADRGEGLEQIAEHGMAGALGAVLAQEVGLTVPLSPGAFAVSPERAGRPPLLRHHVRPLERLLLRTG